MMMKKLIEFFIGSVVLLAAIVVIMAWIWNDHYDVSLRLVLTETLIVLAGAGLMTLIQYYVFKKKNGKK
ncbi:MAG: hypothetical protein IJK07_03375 [Bacteroidales bacterium]|nr:hypothetical protein [Bacteroidales bacterium]